MQSKEIFISSDFELFKQLAKQFFTKRETRKVLMKLTDEQKKDIGLPVSAVKTPRLPLSFKA